MDGLIAGVEDAARGRRHGRPPTIRSSHPRRSSRPRSPSAAQGGAPSSVAQRVWRKDDTLWGEHGAPEIGDRLGWLTISEPMLEHAGDLRAFVRGVPGRGPRGVRAAAAWAARASGPR